MKVGKIKSQPKPPKPLVVVEIHGGVTNTTTYGEADVLQIDWDMFGGGWDDAEVREYLNDLDEEIAPLLERIPEKHRDEILKALAINRESLNQE